MFSRRNASPERTLSSSRLASLIKPGTPLVYRLIDTDVFVQQNEAVRWQGSVAYLDGVGLAAPQSLCGGIFCIGVEPNFLMSYARPECVFAFGRMVPSFLRTSLGS